VSTSTATAPSAPTATRRSRSGPRPQYVIAGILGGGAGVAWAAEHSIFTGLIGVLVFLAAVSLAVNGEYPRSLFDYVVGLNRWIVRVVLTAH
jgi:hypothetical protein